VLHNLIIHSAKTQHCPPTEVNHTETGKPYKESEKRYEIEEWNGERSHETGEACANSCLRQLSLSQASCF